MPSPRRRTRLTPDRVRELFLYDLNTGELAWRVDRSRTAKAGDVAGFVRKDGFITVTIEGQPWMAQRLIWLYVHRRLPAGRLYFRDGNPQNLAFDNIEEETSRHSVSPAAVYQRARRERMRQS